MATVTPATSALGRERATATGWMTERLDLLMPLTPPARGSSYDMTSASTRLPVGSTARPAPGTNQKRLRRKIMNRRTVLRLGVAGALGALATAAPAFAQQKLLLKATDVHPLGYPTVEAGVAMSKKLEAASGGRI